MNIASFKKFDTLNGTGIRHTLFVSGCTHRCNGCFNPQAWNKSFGEAFTRETERMIIDAFRDAPIRMSGLSILGGEPFESAEDLLPFIKECKREFPDMNIWTWSGYTFEELVKDKSKKELLQMCNVLVDGRFILEQKDLTLKFRGSSNQRVIDVPSSLLVNQAITLNF